MQLKYHTDCSAFYDKNGKLFSNPTQTLEELEIKYQEATTKYHEILKASGLRSKLDRARVAGYHRVSVEKMKKK